MAKPIFQAINAILPAFPKPFTLNIASNAKTAVYGPQKRDLLNAVAGKVVDSTNKISFPGIGHDMWPSQAIQFVSFGESNSSSAQAPFVGARYESFRDEHDLSLESVLRSKAPVGTTEQDIIEISEKLDLKSLWSHWFVGLSNGQSRRAQLAAALLRKPRLLVMDEPFLGLDPENRQKFSEILMKLPVPVVIGLRGGDIIPQWVNQTVFASSKHGVVEGEKANELIKKQLDLARVKRERKIEDAKRDVDNSTSSQCEPVIEMKDLTVWLKRAERPIFDRMNLTVYNGERVHIRGPNGSGKSTLLAVITADHPQSWSNDVRLFGERLEVGKHSYFSINQRIGHSSPEVHAIFPKFLTAKRAISTGFSGSTTPLSTMTPEQIAKMGDIAAKLEIDLESPIRFGEMSLSEQKLVLLARALVKSPRILILDEAFSTLTVEQMERAFEVVNAFDGAVLVVGHIEEEIPVCDKEVILGKI